MKTTVIILAAGLGTRMKSGMAKALHEVAGRPMLLHVLDAVKATGPQRVIAVLGHQAERVRASLTSHDVETVIQEQQLGTGHAVRQAADVIAAAEGPVIVLCADTPLLTPETILQLTETHVKTRAAVTVLTARLDDPFGYGRIIKNRTGVLRIVEEKDASAFQRKILEVNTGIYCFEKAFLLSALDGITNSNAQKEYYLTDAVALARKKRRRVSAVVSEHPEETLGINSRVDLAAAEREIRRRINHRWMLQGVTLKAPERTFIGNEVSIGRDTVVHANVQLEGSTIIGEDSVIMPGTRVVDCVVGDGVTIKDNCVIEQSRLGDRVSIGPFAHIRPGTVLEQGARIGNFVEIKKSRIGEGSKANHLSYIGDAEVGKDVNIGAGVITCNYDGFLKHKTVIEDNVFVGSDAQLIAPVKIGKGALVAAGSTVTRNVPPDALAISRTPQENREGVAGRRRKMKQQK